MRQRGVRGVLMASTAEDVELVVTAHRVGEKFGDDDLLFPPHHAVLEGGIDVMLGVQAVVDHFDVVEQADEHVRIERTHLIEIKGTEQAVPPAECGVGVDDDVGVVLDRSRRGDDVLECSTSQGCEATQRKIEDPTRSNVRPLAIHHVADVEELDVLALLATKFRHLFEVGLLVNADLTCDDGSHVKSPLG